ncbi:Septation initiation network scaffold cdc11 [Hyphodiscus hymeniophilus]|uniref:Septation initiation network scaffold cdc11 n=1 Tax=Hyphodiscus hymeniophilus TaxID=353542 RepID=A0A9P6VPB6_9HELO|nr:Septation initiation network scaffold cdc11 [Hyphodiscus hymeniophilus]
MDGAWLDSLSEDWVSQPRSSGSPVPSLPSMASSTSDSRVMSSRIPRQHPEKISWTAGGDIHRPLAERSPSDNNIRLSQPAVRRPSKLRRSFSASSAQSAPYDTIQHNKSVTVSPEKGSKETPEWKRRLLDGEVAYGEQRDLFAPAGLESIFCPPPSQKSPPTKLPKNRFQDGSIYMPSSPPPYNWQHGSQQSEADNLQEEVAQQNRNRQQPRVVQYKLADVEVAGSEFSANDLSRSSSFRPGMLEGGIDYAALDVPPEELQERLEKLKAGSDRQSVMESEEPPSDAPADVTAETEHLAPLGTFVNVRRGGRSHEGSFQNRPLSPSSLPAIDESALLPEESMQASTPKQLPNIKKTRPSKEYDLGKETQISPPPVPQTPHPSPAKPVNKVDKSSSGSPLKLFGTYDTFTNQKLLRRLSQFEERFDEDSEMATPSVFGQDSTGPGLNDAFVAESSPLKGSQGDWNLKKTARKFSSFGDGELDGFQFSEDISYDAFESRLEEDDKENLSLPVLDPSTQTRFKFQLEASPALEEGTFTEKRTKLINTTSTTRKKTITVRKTGRPHTGSSEEISEPTASQRIENLETPRKHDGNSEGKRLPRSPLKDPTPKRRRTLQQTDLDEDKGLDLDLELDSLKDTHQQMQSVIGRKRKDARRGDDQQAANPKVLAMRQILRPRTPTPSQRNSQQHERSPLQEIDDATERENLQREKIAKFQAELDTTDPLKMSVVLGMGQQMLNDSRKGSVTTQDFLDEAKKIMAGIRGKARPRSGLASVEESESENGRNKPADHSIGDEILEESYQESTQEPFSRPPSREGGAPLPRLPLRQEDPEILSHLQKYQEMSDMDGIIGSSVKSIAAAREAVASAIEIRRMTEETISKAFGSRIRDENVVESEPPNMRISENVEMQRKRKHSGSSVRTNGEDLQEAEFPSHGSNASSGQSTTQSIPTGSSKNSDSRRVIAPHTVSHLIPEQLAGMVFDREKNAWVKGMSSGGLGGSHNFLPSDETEDDPFGDIPDLSVDETQELQRIKAVAAKRKEDERVAQINQDNLHLQGLKSIPQNIQITSEAPNGRIYADPGPSSEPSKLTRFTSSGATAADSNNTRVTSWGDDLLPVTEQSRPTESQKQPQRQMQKSMKLEIRKEVAEKSEEEIEREISPKGDRVKHRTPRKHRNVTISFSSPIASVIGPSPYDNEDSIDHVVNNASDLDDDPEEDFEDSVIIRKRGDSNSKTTSNKKGTALRSTSTRLSISRHTFSARPVSRIDECDEESVNGDNDERNERSISVVVSTPIAPERFSSLVATTPRPMREAGNISLTPMSAFTIHKANESFGLEVSYIAEDQRLSSGSNNKRTLSLSIKQLVEKIAEIEPCEPFWEHLKQIELRDKNLTNLHKLDEFCEQLEVLDVSKNQITQLNGAPTSLRHLRVAHNKLSELTAWGNLSNLQYLDVSNNELESLSAFQNLVHLRGLKADNNKITSLDGIRDLDGLLSVRMRGNMIESLDFAGTKLQRLADLDLRDNRIHDVKNLRELRSLSTLDLEDNELSTLSMEFSDTLKYLKLSGNNLESIDVNQCPNLRLLYLDRNCLGTITGLLRTKHLDSLSMREQQDGAVVDPAFLDEAFEVRKLFLSGNLLHAFAPRVRFLNLQYLELANCGIESLPTEFGEMVPNTRVLNLNFNALKDIRPILGIVRLKRLYLAGNRISKLRRTTDTLDQLQTLSLVDLRSNPLTQGFYSPLPESRLVKIDADGDPNRSEPFTLGRADREKDEKYAARLDMATRTSRRIYEMLIVGGCCRLKVLDGLDADRDILSRRDKVWDLLVSAGIVEDDPITEREDQEAGIEKDDKEEPKPGTALESDKSSIWQGEDSFA